MSALAAESRFFNSCADYTPAHALARGPAQHDGQFLILMTAPGRPRWRPAPQKIRAHRTRKSLATVRPGFDPREGSERNSTDHLDAPRLGHRTVPGAETLAGRIVVKRNAIAECLAIAREVVIVERVESLGAHFETQALLDGELPRQRYVDIPIGRTAHAAHARAGAEIESVRSEERKSTRLNSSHLVISYAVFCLKK